jgi:hypothetical protein
MDNGYQDGIKPPIGGFLYVREKSGFDALFGSVAC